MAMVFKSTFNHANKLFVEVVYKWLCHCSFYLINVIEYVQDKESMAMVATQYAQHSAGIMNGCIGALDGWKVKIKMPTKEKDNVSKPSSFYSRKGYFGLNVQCIVDKQKRVLFHTIKSRGVEHDSKNSNLYKYLMNNYLSLCKMGYYFIGDSAYELKSFLLTPYDNAFHGTPEDNFNYFHSSSYISGECAFREVDLCWVIF